MAVFSSSEGERTRDGGRGGPRDSNLSIVATGMKVVGEVSSNGVIKVEGTVEGTVRADRQVLVAKDGTIQGDIYTREAVIGGRVTGSIFADERVEVQPQSVVRGDIITQRLVVQEGGEVNGNVQMTDPKIVDQQARKGARQGEATPPRPQPTVPHQAG
jgi:cytoskeletal protein CcmA (bactofilin family)